VGMALSTERTSSLLPAGFSRRPCHPASLDLDLSTVPCTCTTQR
jgi:hypothetical protein